MRALKEWATIVRALENGDQTVILRKGGILETASGFEIESKKFLLFPTFEHQESNHIKPQFQKYLNQVMDNKPKDGYNRTTSYAEVIYDADVKSEEKINALSPFHVWSDSYIKTRINWMPEKPLKAIFLKVFKIPEFKIPLKSEYQGCKSWIDINDNVSVGKPVLNDDILNSKLKEFKEIVS